MQIGKFTFKNRKWFYNNMELANPLIIIWKAIWLIPVYASLYMFAAAVAIFNLNISDFKYVIDSNP